MAVPPETTRKDVTMLEVETANVAVPDSNSISHNIRNNSHNSVTRSPLTNGTAGSHPPSMTTISTTSTSTGHTQHPHPQEPIFVAMDQDDFQARSARESVLQRLSEALLGRSLAKIDLSQRGLQPSDARLVRMALSQNANLTSLKLGYNNLGDAGVTTLATGIAVHKSLVSLDLGFNNIGDEGCKALASAMQQAASLNHGKTLLTLYLAGNLIGEDGAFALADCIRRGSSLRKLYMTGNRLGAFGVKALTEAITEQEWRRRDSLSILDAKEEEEDDNVLHHPHDNNSNNSSNHHHEHMEEDDGEDSANDGSKSTNNSPTATTAASSSTSSSSSSTFLGMQELFFGGTGMGHCGCQAVSQLLAKTSCLRVLSLPNCSIGDDEIKLLASAIKSNRQKLPVESIQLSFNDITYKGLEMLVNSIWGSLTIRELRLDNNNIGDRGAHQVAAVLPYVKTLEVLDVGFNSIKAAGLNTLMKAVAETQHLQSLSISGNAIDVAAAKAVAYALAYNRSLKSLFLVHCTIGHEGRRHISAGIVSNSRIALRKLIGFSLGPVVATLGFPPAIEHWSNEQVLNFIHLMWKDDNEQSEEERELDPLSFLPTDDENGLPSGCSRDAFPHRPFEASIVVDVAKKTYEGLVANGVDVFSRRKEHPTEPSFGSPLAGDAIIVESEEGTLSTREILFEGNDHIVRSSQARSFVAAPESSSCSKEEMHDPARKKRIVEWLCSNIKHLNELAQLPFCPSEMWRLHQHYFTPVVNESGGAVAVAPTPEDRIVYSVPEVSRAKPGGSAAVPVIQSGELYSDPALPASPKNTSLPMLKRKVSYRFLGEAMLNANKHDSRQNLHMGSSVARMIEEGHTGHSMPPKTKKARRNRTRISFVPRIKAKLDSYLDVCHEKALSTMRQLYFVEKALLRGEVNPLNPSMSPRTHLSGVLASEAEMIVVDMI